MAAHAKLGPSNHRWPKCPGSIREEKKFPYDMPGEAAIDGTGTHELIELCLNNNVRADAYDTQVIGVDHKDRPMGWFVDKDRIDRAQICLDYVTRRVGELKAQYPDAEITVEAESLSDPGIRFGRKDWWGTVDITIIVVSDGVVHTVEVIDYKDGRMYVSEKWNTQLISYLYGKMAQYNVDLVHNCRMTIIQPKTGTPIRYMCSKNPDHQLSVSKVIEEAEKLAEAAKKTDDPNAPLVSGKHCQWCKANPKRGGHCTAATEKSVEVVMENLPTITDGGDLMSVIQTAVADVKSLTVQQLAQLADAEDGLKAAFDKVRKEIIERINMDEEVPGYAMVPGNSSRVYSEDEEAVVKALKSRRMKKDEIYPSKLISPAQVMKAKYLTEKQKELFERKYITTMAGKLTLKKVAYDHKPAKDVTMMFDNVAEKKEEVKQEVSFL